MKGELRFIKRYEQHETVRRYVPGGNNLRGYIISELDVAFVQITRPEQIDDIIDALVEAKHALMWQRDKQLPAFDNEKLELRLRQLREQKTLPQNDKD